MRDYEELVRELRGPVHSLDCEFCNRKCCYPDGVSDDKCVIIQAADAIEELCKQVASCSKWISVDERPIAEPGNYITMTNASGKNNGVIAQKFVKTTIRGKPVERWEWCGRVSPWTVTHYMHLPEPPKEADNEH